jgi:hypothetical protein
MNVHPLNEEPMQVFMACIRVIHPLNEEFIQVYSIRTSEITSPTPRTFESIFVSLLLAGRYFLSGPSTLSIPPSSDQSKTRTHTQLTWYVHQDIEHAEVSI